MTPDSTTKKFGFIFRICLKCYDRVDTRILRHAMTRLKIPTGFINLTLDLFTNRKNYVLTDVGKTKDYDVLVGIDQGEVISPLLWCIYYDPLLTRIQADRSLGYSISHTYSDDIHAPTIPLPTLHLSRRWPIWTIRYGALRTKATWKRYSAQQLLFLRSPILS